MEIISYQVTSACSASCHGNLGNMPRIMDQSNILVFSAKSDDGRLVDNENNTQEDELGLIYILMGSATVLFAISLLLGEEKTVEL